MTPGKPSHSDRRTAEAPAVGPDRVRQDMEMIFHRMRAGSRPAPGDVALPTPCARDAIPTGRRPRLLADQIAALLVLVCALGAFFVGALASNGQSGASASRIAPRLAAEVNRATPPSSTVPTPSKPERPSRVDDPGDGGEAVVRAFYNALGRGDGEEASALVVAEKRGSRVYSPQAISRFYGGLPEPLRLTAITPLGRGAYRAGYRYSAGGSRCDGEAVVSLTSREGRELIRSIRVLNGC